MEKRTSLRQLSYHVDPSDHLLAASSGISQTLYFLFKVISRELFGYVILQIERCIKSSEEEDACIVKNKLVGT